MFEKLGIGVDIVDCEQFKKIPYSSKSGFYKKLFTASEIKYCLRYKDSYIHFGGKFAIKEAVKKSINTNIDMRDIKISHSNSKPVVLLCGKLAKKYRFLVSLSHDKNIAVAIVISEKI